MENKLVDEVTKESEEFLRSQGIENMRRVNFLEFLRYCGEKNFEEGDVRRFKIDGRGGFEQSWGKRANGETVYVTLIANYDDGNQEKQE